MVIFLIVPLALILYVVGLRLLFRSFRYRWAVWLWGVTFVLQLPFFFN